MDLGKELFDLSCALNRARAIEIQGDPVLAVAARVLPIAADELKADNDRADLRAAALLDSRDEADRRQRADQEIIANRLCVHEDAIAYGAHASITWAPDQLSFASESRDEQVARWAGFRLLSEIRNEHDDQTIDLIWWGTRRTEAGTFAAQFDVMAGE